MAKIFQFFKESRAELKKVVWPTPRQLVNSTVAVITIVLVTALIVFVLDLGFEAVKTHGIDKLQASLQSNNTVEDSTASDETDEASSESTTENEEEANSASTSTNSNEAENAE